MIKTLRAVSVFFALVSMAGGALAGGDAKAGADKAGLCMGCHGDNGMAVNPECPNLAGQKPGYIIKQLQDFIGEKRHNDTMSPMAALAGEAQDIKDIAAFFASQKDMTAKNFMMPAPADEKNITKGKNLFLNGNPKTGLYGCVNCHGQNGKGKSPTNQVFPVIGGQHKAYLEKQLKDFRTSSRSNDPANMMMDIARKLTDEEIDAITDYLASL